MAAASVPDWMTTSFFQSCLQTHEKQCLTVTNFTVKPTGIPDGNNYGSQIIRVTVDYDMGDAKTSTTLILKCPLADLKGNRGHIYDTEETFYKVFVKETSSYSNLDFIPKHYISPLPRIVILEDLCTSGYKTVNRGDFLGYEQCKLFVKAKAKLHALSVAVYRDNPEIIEALVKKPTTGDKNNNNVKKQLMKISLQCVIAHLEDSSHNNDYLEIIKEASKNDNMWEMYKEVEDSLSNKSLKVLVQCDPWCTNMMFKYDDSGKVENIKVLDFQNLALSSPLREIVTFMCLCPNIEVRRAKSIELFHLYSDTLNENLADLQCQERVNFEDMMSEVASMPPWILHLVCFAVPTLVSEEAATLNDYLSTNILNEPITAIPAYRFYQGATFDSLFPQYLEAIAKEGVFNNLKQQLKTRKSG